jgi:hypothetical protein
MIEAQGRGADELNQCIQNIRLELDCLELEGRLHQRLYQMLYSHPTFPSFMSRTPDSIKETIAISCYNARLHPDLSFEDKLSLRDDISTHLASIYVNREEAPFFREALHLARTVDLQPPGQTP